MLNKNGTVPRSIKIKWRFLTREGKITRDGTLPYLFGLSLRKVKNIVGSGGNQAVTELCTV
jgi:hypothetical protein